MPQSLNQKAVNNFVKGLITEAAELTFPEGASVDELNCDLRRDGTRRRRLGVALEEEYTLSSFTLSDSEITSTGDWVNVGGNADLEFLVLQKGATLYFYNKSDVPYSAQLETNSVNLNTYVFSGSAGADVSKCQFTSLKGNLIVSSPGINTIAVSYSSGTFTATQIDFKVRDFQWQGDTSTYYEDEASPSQDRKYDAQNAGWNTGNGAPTDLTKRLTHPWYSGKDTDGNYLEAEFDKIYAGTTLTGNGHYVLDFFEKNRGSASGLTGLTNMTEEEGSRFRCVESFAGRVFYAGLDSAENAGTILFSKLVENVDDLGVCHQQNDPTAEYLSDLYDTDGGEVKIPDAVKIQRLYAYQSSLFVFAENGVWQIAGVDGVFKASSYSINRVSRIGILNAESFVAAEGNPFWWSRFGIHTLGTDPVSGQGQEQNLTIPTIQSFWDKISSDAKLKVTAAYDSINKRIYWAYPDDDETVESKLNNFLILDIPLQAFYPWKVSDQSTLTDSIVGFSFYSGYGAKELQLDVTANSGADDVMVLAPALPINGTTLDFITTSGSDLGTLTVNLISNTLSIGDTVSFAGIPVLETDPIIIAVLGIDFADLKLNEGSYTVTATTATSFTVGVTYAQTATASSSTDFTWANFTPTPDPKYIDLTGPLVDDVISTQISAFNTGDPAIILICRDGATNKLTMGSFSSISFLDWGDTNYSSFAETGYDFAGDLITKKNAPYIAVYSRVTETGFTGNEISGYEAVRPSSLLVSTAWDFAEDFSTAQQANRKKYPVIPDPNNLDLYDYPETVITTRLKIRGHGRSMRIRYESEQGKDFLLLGWGIIAARNPRF